MFLEFYKQSELENVELRIGIIVGDLSKLMVPILFSIICLLLHNSTSVFHSFSTYLLVGFILCFYLNLLSFNLVFFSHFHLFNPKL